MFGCDDLLYADFFQERQLETTHGTNLDDMETSTFVTVQFLENVRKLIGYAIDAVHHGSSIILMHRIIQLSAELAGATMPVYLFNDLFAYTTIDISEQVFVVMEEKASIWRTVCDPSITGEKSRSILLRPSFFRRSRTFSFECATVSRERERENGVDSFD
jgi:hypothetical protein